jgi:NAD(P)-dependent dehydrogenase (short-subunit alcohol dehydrogenase family)
MSVFQFALENTSMTQRVLITAGAGGIGLVIARAFVTNGARVHVVDVNEQAVRAMTSEHTTISATVGDISRSADLDALFDDVQKHLGGLDVLVNNAGIAGPTASVVDYPIEAWNAVVDINLTGTFMVTQRAIPWLRQSPAASIVVMSSLAGRFGYANRVAYSTTKWGLVGFTKTLSLELGPLGITANSIHPGAVAGSRLESVFEGRARISGRTAEQEADLAMANQSIKRFIDPADIAALVLFLAGPSARTISGQMFPIDGDARAAS